MTMPARTLASCLLLAALLAATAMPLFPFEVAGPREAAAAEFQDGRIAFARFVDPPGTAPGNYEIFTMDSGGGDIEQLTDNTTGDRQPAWSPDGARIAFSHEQGTVATINVMDSNGANAAPLTNGHVDSYPAWSPDGARIAFIRQESFGQPNQLYVMDASGANQRNLNVPGGSIFGPEWSPDGQRIAFFATLPERIFTVRSDGSDLQELGPGFSPSWSPDGTRIAFGKIVGGQSDIFVMNADGSGATNRTNTAASDDEPDWSPSGDSIAYVTYVGNRVGEISTMFSAGVQQRNRTNTPDIFEEGPSWQPIPIPPLKLPVLDRPKFDRGELIVFSSARVTPENPEGDEEIFTLETRRFNDVIRQLTSNTSEEDAFPEWSPDGSKIVFTRNRAIFTMNADGTNQVRLTQPPGQKVDIQPTWSPDGTKIVFSSNRDSSLGQLFVIDADGSNLTKLTNTPRSDGSPDWSPDGAKIVFNRIIGSDAIFCLFTINPDGSGLTQLTFERDGNNEGPAWSPDGTRIAFVRNATSVYTMAADGTNQREVVRSPDQFGPQAPRWSPDGRALVFNAEEIYTVKANGTSLSNRTKGLGGRFPDWKPSPTNTLSAAAMTTSSSGVAADKRPPHKKDDKHKPKNKQGKPKNKKEENDKRDKHGKRHAGGRDRNRKRDRGARLQERAQVSEPRHVREQRGDRKRRD